jgi:hypothetical protein
LPWALVAILTSLALALGAAAYAVLRARRRRAGAGDEDPAVTELHRALARLGRAEPGLTLAQLERRLQRDGHTRAAAYVGAIARRRFERAPSPARRPGGRGQLRRALAPRGLAGRARALAALPPRWATPRGR